MKSQNLINYTSTGDKILLHPAAVSALAAGKNYPITLHIMPTERCNLKCEFCSVANRKQDRYDLDEGIIIYAARILKNMGLRSVIISGGGEPLLYHEINFIINTLHDIGLDIGLITNGTLFHRLTSKSISALSWVRVSANAYDYVGHPDIATPPILPSHITLGMSYIWGHRESERTIEFIKKLVEERRATSSPIEYVRLLPDCNLETSQLEAAHTELAKRAAELGPPFFHQWKSHGRPKSCHLGRVHPVLYADGYIYPCDSLVLNSPANDKRFHEEFALCYWRDIKTFYEESQSDTLVDTRMCPHCVFKAQNDLIETIRSGNQLTLVNIPTKHINFV